MRKILRTQQIVIDLPKPNTEPWMHVTVQYVEMSDDLQTPINTVDRWNQFSVRVAAVAGLVYPLVDPVQPPAGLISNAGIVQNMGLSVIDMIIQRYGGTLDQASGYIILE